MEEEVQPGAVALDLGQWLMDPPRPHQHAAPGSTSICWQDPAACKAIQHA